MSSNSVKSSLTSLECLVFPLLCSHNTLLMQNTPLMCIYRMVANASSRQGLLVGFAFHFLCLLNGGRFLFQERLS